MFENAFGTERLDRLSETPSTFEEWLNQQGESRQWAPTTFNRYHEAGRAMFNWARRHRYTRENPFDRIDRLSTRGRKRRIEIRPEQEESLFAALDKLPERMAREICRRLCAALDCGLRAGEMLRVQRKHVRFGPSDEAWVIELPSSIAKAERTRRSMLALVA